MRVISGLRKGHKLMGPKDNKIRPTEDRVKESLFNIIGSKTYDKIMLDAFSGTGSIGIEFLSRGGRHCYFVDKSKESINIIEKNIEHTKFQDRASIINQDIFQAIKSFKIGGIRFDYIYIDPPFRADKLIEDLLVCIKTNNILGDSGLILIEHEIEYKPVTSDFNEIDYRKYGSKAITFFSNGRW